ncbi:hypothetical protein SS1G_12121 [Sclerotinia sclerotiorum 1980 UF-70]|uniref:CCHC-type domain-containing protein n=1 Tax=Sclerotinia sclerotiorum (strain ATCC 18683 / 1980 / Ss-1) TaxID=665079 RepID=A7F2H4_SCLS1|nr:hypothetical protein SS1G_12121 [Sclerotinia sclerotiorum 1980 UF-70]EDN95916.1 hypothetical protein SS1G_12121 [Sclerotinia sclerotiorum 1980 UF-70]
MTPNNISEWNSGQIPADANNLADWTFDINEMADFDFGDIPQMAPVVHPPFILSSPTPSQPFNFQTQRNTLSSDDPFKSPINRPTLQFNNKRRRPPSHSEPHINSPKEAIQKARSLLILAASLEEDTEEQSKVLDLIEIFREYLEKGKLTKASNIIISQISHLENATKRIEKQANHLSNLPSHMIPPTINAPGTKASYATITKTSGEWNLVTKAKPTKQKTTEQKEEAPSKRLILIKPLIYQPPSFTPLNTRNKVNEAFKKAGINRPVISAITTTRSGNFILTTNSPFNAQFLMEKKEIWDKILDAERIQIDKPWHKVIIHKIPIQEFSGLKDGAIVIAFATQKEADITIQKRLYIAGISVRVERFYPSTPSSQCNRCQGFGHNESYCKKPPACGLCSNNHATVGHFCIICQAKGKPCQYLSVKCVNCKGEHKANSKSFKNPGSSRILRKTSPQPDLLPTPASLNSSQIILRTCVPEL